MDLAAWRDAVDCDWRVLDVAPKELCAEHEATSAGNTLLGVNPSFSGHGRSRRRCWGL